jgi:hypothetical protein
VKRVKRIVAAIHNTGRVMVPMSLMLLLGCSKIPSDAKLKELFYASRDDFNRLVQMSEQGARVVRIDFDFTNMNTDSGPQKNVGLSPERWQEYRALFKKLGLKDGLERRRSIVLFYVECEGSAIDGDCKGIAYSNKPLAPKESSLDRMPPDGSFFEPLSASWYLFRWVS